MLAHYARRGSRDLRQGDFVKWIARLATMSRCSTPEGVLRLAGDEAGWTGRSLALSGGNDPAALTVPGWRSSTMHFTEGRHDQHARTSVFVIGDLER